MIQEGMQDLLDLLEEQMGLDQNQRAHPWDPRNLGISILRTYINSPELKSSIWRTRESVEPHYLDQKIVYLVPAGFPQSHSGWQCFMSGAGDITHPHIDPPITRSLMLQVVGRKLWCTWPATGNNLVEWEKTTAPKRTWQWAMKKLSPSGRKVFIAEPGTWWVLKICEIHACVSLSPSVHASQEFFLVDDAEETLNLWKATDGARKKSREKLFAPDTPPEDLKTWLPPTFDGKQNLDPSVENAINLYKYGRNMVVSGESDQVTMASELHNMLPLVRDWIEKEAHRVQHQ